MKRRLPPVLILLGLPALLGLALAVVAVIAAQRPAPWTGKGVVYSVAQVRQNLIQNPIAWRGREVLVRGTTVGATWTIDSNAVYFSCSPPRVCAFPVPAGRIAHIYLVDDSQYRPHIPTPNEIVLRVSSPPPDPLRAFLRRLPGTGALLPTLSPPSLAVRGGVSHIYRVRLLGLKYSLCSPGTVCDNAAVLDARP